jgi:hypothetical protein
MDSVVFLLTWVYGLVIMACISYLSFHVMECWAMRHIKKCAMFGLLATAVEAVGLTLFAYCTTTLSHMLTALGATTLYFTTGVVVVWVVKHVFHVKDLP